MWGEIETVLLAIQAIVSGSQQQYEPWRGSGSNRRELHIQGLGTPLHELQQRLTATHLLRYTQSLPGCNGQMDKLRKRKWQRLLTSVIVARETTRDPRIHGESCALRVSCGCFWFFVVFGKTLAIKIFEKKSQKDKVVIKNKYGHEKKDAGWLIV